MALLLQHMHQHVQIIKSTTSPCKLNRFIQNFKHKRFGKYEDVDILLVVYMLIIMADK